MEQNTTDQLLAEVDRLATLALVTQSSGIGLNRVPSTQELHNALSRPNSFIEKAAKDDSQHQSRLVEEQEHTAGNQQTDEPSQEDIDLEGFEIVEGEELSSIPELPCQAFKTHTVPVKIPLPIAQPTTRRVFEAQDLIKRITTGRINSEDVKQQNELAIIITRCLDQGDIDSLIGIINSACSPTKQLPLYNPVIVSRAHHTLDQSLKELHAKHTRALEKEIEEQTAQMNKLLLQLKDVTLRFAGAYQTTFAQKDAELEEGITSSTVTLNSVYETLKKVPRLSQTFQPPAIPPLAQLRNHPRYMQHKEETQRLMSSLVGALAGIQTVRPLQIEQ